MSDTIKSFVNSKINQWQLFTDLISLIAIFSAILYIGGYVFIKSYFEKFFMTPDIIKSDVTFYITTFVDQVILKNILSSLIVFLLILTFATFFYLSRNLLKSWWGYISLCIWLVLLFFLTTIFAKQVGYKNANRDWYEERSYLPKVSFILEDAGFDVRLLQMGAQSQLRLLYEGEQFYYFFKPRTYGDQSDLPIYVVPKNYVLQLNIFNIRHD